MGLRVASELNAFWSSRLNTGTVKSWELAADEGPCVCMLASSAEGLAIANCREDLP
jgi:hypothetical protein